MPIDQRVEYFLAPVRQEVAYLRAALSVLKGEIGELRSELDTLRAANDPKTPARAASEEKPVRRRT